MVLEVLSNINRLSKECKFQKFDSESYHISNRFVKKRKLYKRLMFKFQINKFIKIKIGPRNLSYLLFLLPYTQLFATNFPNSTAKFSRLG